MKTIFKNLFILGIGLMFLMYMSNDIKKKSKFKKYIIDKNHHGIYRTKDNRFYMEIYKEGGNYIIDMKGKTTGWIAVGFGQNNAMKNGEIIIGYIKNKKINLSHHFAVSYYRHKPINKLQKTSKKVIKIISGNESNGYTEIKFKRKVGVKGKYYKKFASGEKINFMWAVGKNDNIRKRHRYRGTAKIILP